MSARTLETTSGPACDFSGHRHANPAVVSRVLADLDAEYGTIAKMTITRGKVHKYLGMTIDYSSLGKVILSMID